MTARWVGLNDLAAETGMSVRNLQYIRAQEPGVLVTRQKGSATQYKQPDCAISLRQREVKKAEATIKTSDADESAARARKMSADADRSEIAAARLRSELAPVAEMDRAVERLATAVRNEVSGLRSRFALRIVGLKTPLEAALVLDDMAKQILSGLVGQAEQMADIADDMEDAA
jgi:hypothetical protein